MRGSASACRKDADGVLGCLAGGLENEIPHGGATVFGLLTSVVGRVTGQPYPADDYARSLNPGDPREAVLDFAPAYEADETIVSLEINHESGDYRFTSLTGYHQSGFDARNDYDFAVASEPWPVEVTVQRGPDGPITVDRAYISDRSVTEPEQWSQEFRLASDFDGSLNFLLGAFYLNYRNDLGFTAYAAALERYAEVFGIPQELRAFDNQTRDYELETGALFGELYYAPGDKTEFTLGLRYTDEEKSAEQRAIYLDFLDDPADENQGFQHYGGDWQETTGKFNVSYHASEDVMLFLTLARSYKSGGFNPVSPNSPILDPEQGGDPSLAEFDPEYINSVEIGARTRLFDNTLQANLSGFYYDYSDLQVSKIVQQTSVNENVDAEILGLEAELVWAPNARWRFSLVAAWLDSEIGEFQSFDPADPNQMGTTEGIVSAGDRNIYLPCACAGLDVDLEGNRLPNAPEYSVNAAVAYALPLSNGWTLDLATLYYYQDEFYARIFNTVNDTIESWDVWNASARLSGPGLGWYAEAWVRNIQDEDHRTGQFLQDPAVGLYTTVQLLEPRTYGVTLGFRF
jgi:outer membrane receptor protein involved in Fe transport